MTRTPVLVNKGHLDFSGAGSGSCPWLVLGLDKLVFLHLHNITFLIHSPGLQRQMLKSGRQLRFRRLLLLSPGLAQGTAGRSTGWRGLLLFQPGCSYVFASTYFLKTPFAVVQTWLSYDLSPPPSPPCTPTVLTVEAAGWDSNLFRDRKLDKMVPTEEMKILAPPWSST